MSLKFQVGSALLVWLAFQSTYAQELTPSEIESSVSAPALSSVALTPDQAEARRLSRLQILAAVPHRGRREKLSDPIETLVKPDSLKITPGAVLRDPRAMETLKLTSATLKLDVWSGPSWEEFRGGTAIRYILAPAMKAVDWLTAWAFVSTPGQTLADVLAGDSKTAVDDLGPAEKYDLLLQSRGVATTPALSGYEWNLGRETQLKEGKVLHWYGYCHGWAAASFLSPRPQKAVSVPIPAPFGQPQSVIFYPSDIKALSTVLWANALPPLAMLGSRCSQLSPKHDANGRVIDEACFDVNPGTFHIALINQVGNAGRVLLMDGSYDVEIWNQPVFAYSYVYFNPQTGKAGAFDKSAIAMADYHKDKFHKYRAVDAKSVVGVVMKVTYGHEGAATHALVDGPKNDNAHSVKYVYDLELDDAGTIIGGEWAQAQHPDFLWGFNDDDAKAVSLADAALTGEWSVTAPLPADWVSAARGAASSQGVPLAHIVDGLISASRE